MQSLAEIASWLPSDLQLSQAAATSTFRLFVAAVLGGAIGLERELKHRPAGLRTNMFICFGAAMFTILSERLVSPTEPDHTRIAAQIITGIGFIGAGSILRDAKGAVSGLTSAATIFVVAGIGMAAGGGLYQTAIFATVLALACLLLLGQVEARFNLKPVTAAYDVIATQCENADQALDHLNQVLDELSISMQSVRIARAQPEHCHVQFTVEAYRSQQEALRHKLKHDPMFTTTAFHNEGEKD